MYANRFIAGYFVSSVPSLIIKDISRVILRFLIRFHEGRMGVIPILLPLGDTLLCVISTNVYVLFFFFFL